VEQAKMAFYSLHEPAAGLCVLSREARRDTISQSPDAKFGVWANSLGFFGLGTGGLGRNTSPKRWVDVLKDASSCDPLVKNVEGSGAFRKRLEGTSKK
jgi:hypothetical protein